MILSVSESKLDCLRGIFGGYDRDTVENFISATPTSIVNQLLLGETVSFRFTSCLEHASIAAEAFFPTR